MFFQWISDGDICQQMTIRSAKVHGFYNLTDIFDSRVAFLAEKPYGDDTIKNFSFRSLLEVERKQCSIFL